MNAAVFPQSISVAVIASALLLASRPVAAQLAPHPALASTGQALHIQKGLFAESVVNELLRARDFEVVTGNVGPHGIDRIAFKRGPDGALREVRFVEVKYLETGNTFKLATTADGKQLSDAWIKARLAKLVERNPGGSVRNVAEEVLDFMHTRPEMVTRELHGISFGSGRYAVYRVDAAGEINGIAAEQRLGAVLKSLAKRGISAQTRRSAARHLAQLDQLQAAGRKPVATAAASAAEEDSAGLLLPGAAERAIVVESPAAARGVIRRIVLSPGVGAAAFTFVIDEGFSGWNYYEGNSTTAQFEQETVRNAGKALAVGSAVQLVCILAPAPGGLVLVAVGIVSYVVADFAINKFEEALTPRVLDADELHGIVPDQFLHPSNLDTTTSAVAARGKSR